MTVFGIVRAIDGLGRITLPVEYRRRYGWQERERLELLATDQGILLRPLSAKEEPEPLHAEKRSK